MDREEINDKFNTEFRKKMPTIEDAVDYNGKPVDRNSHLCVAKVLRGKVTEDKFFIKRLTIYDNRFFDPYADEIQLLGTKNSTGGRQRWDFALVTEDAYNLYVKYLFTGHSAYLKAAERLS